MTRARLISILLMLILAASCNPRAEVTPVFTPQPTETPKPPETPSRTAPTATPRPVILFERNFEGVPASGADDLPNFQTVSDDTGNHVLCNDDFSGYASAYFGYEAWADYAVQIRVEVLDYREDPWMGLHARLSPGNQFGYYGALNPLTSIQALSYNDPYEDLGHQYLRIAKDTWYTLRLEVLGDQIRFYIDDRLIAAGRAARRSQGGIGISISPHLRVCIDDLRVWALTETGLAKGIVALEPLSLEVIAENADPGNAWGGHQTRIVRTKEGVFTAFVTSGGGEFSRQWHLMWRRGEDDWVAIAQGDAGDGPVNLLASPDGTLHVIGWPKGVGTIWSGKPGSGRIEMAASAIPGVYNGFWSYHAAGIDAAGDICVFTSRGGEAPGGRFMWACYQASADKWVHHTTALDYRYCYTYVFPQTNGRLSLVSTRDVRWSALGYSQPVGEFDYVFNGIAFWRSADTSTSILDRTYAAEEKPSKEFPRVYLNAQQDAYLDTHGQMHILYWIQGPSTSATRISHHLVLSPTGEVLHDVQLPPDEGGAYARIFQDAQGMFYILSSSGFLYPAGNDGLRLGTPTPLDLEGHSVEYSGFGLSVPRTGTAISNIMDVVFPTDGGTKWIYLQLKLSTVSN